LSPSSSPTPEERDVLRKVFNGLKTAVKHKEFDWEYGTKIKREKYCFLALEELLDDIGEHITYSWYKYGFSAYASPTSPESNLRTPDGPLMSPELRETDLYRADEEDFKQIFLNELDDIPLNGENWYRDDLSFLKRFYRLYAPVKYRQLYIENIRLREAFVDITEEVASLIERGDEIQEPDLGYYGEVSDIVTRFHMEMMSEESVRGSLDEVMEYTDLLEDVLMTLEEVTSEELNENHRKVLEHLHEVYEEHIWTIVASSISMETADGPNREVVVETSRNKLEEETDKTERVMKKLRNACGDGGLFPSVEDYPTHDDEMEEKVDELLDTTEGRTK